jgi:hypothetical protein
MAPLLETLIYKNTLTPVQQARLAKLAELSGPPRP